MPAATRLLVDSRSGGLSSSVDEDGFPVLPPTLLTVHRTSTRDEQSRQIVCALDGTRFGQVLFGQRRTIEILPGRHTLRVHNTLVWKTAEFAAEPGEHVHFTVWNRAWGEGHYVLIVFVGWSPLAVGLARGTPAEVESASRVGTGDAPRSGGLWRRRPWWPRSPTLTEVAMKDPVCGMDVEPAQAAGTSQYQGKTYYFCSTSCKAKFDANPSQYAK